VRNSSFNISVICQIGLRHCHNSHFLARLPSIFTLWNQVQVSRLFRRQNFGMGLQKQPRTTLARLSPCPHGEWGVCTPCCLRTSSSTHSHFIPLKYVGHYTAGMGSIFTQKSPRLERGLDHLDPRPAAKPILRHSEFRTIVPHLTHLRRCPLPPVIDHHLHHGRFSALSSRGSPRQCHRYLVPLCRVFHLSP
jgi:hypothetical protein